MKQTKKMAAIAVAASMVLGSSMVAFAEDGAGTTPGGTGTVGGSGVVEGHVDKEVLNVILPTVTDGTTAFAYTMDPERLIQETDAAKYEEGTVFPDKDTDTGVYFLTGPKTYANTSNTYQVINKSSCDVDLTVKVKATQNTAKDISLATSNSVSTSTPELYLGLKVGSTDQAISTTEATVNKTIAGVPGNFKVAVVTGDDGTTKEYAYEEKEDATSWKAMNINMTGVVSKLAIEDTTTAPAVSVTWSWAKASDSSTASSDAVDYTSAPATSSVPSTVTIPESGDITVPVTIGSDNADLTKLETALYTGDMIAMGGGYGATYADGTITLGADVVAFLRGASAEELSAATFTATFGTGDSAYTTSFTFTK